jgi:hypothetical protein
MGRLRERSFGITMLLLAIVAIGPGVSLIAGLLLIFLASQMIAGQPAPIFPRFIYERSLPTRHLSALVRRAVPVLRYLEKFVHPRWPTPIQATKRFVGVVILVLGLTVAFIPIPFSNVLPAFAIAVTSLAYIEEDGLLLSIALLLGIAVMAMTAGAVWQMALGAGWIAGL